MSSSGSADDVARYARTIDLYGRESFERLRAARVAVVGLGGVGSHTAMALARVGIGSLRLVDHDVVSWTSLNRHAVAGPADVGRAKTEVVAEAVARISGGTRTERVDRFVHVEALEAVLAAPLDAVVDAIDSLAPKVALLEACVRRGLPVVSSMGASSRTDPAAVRVGDLSTTTVCPLARRVRKVLRARGIERGVTVVFSLEPPRGPLPPDLDEPRYERGRVRNRQPSSSALPGIFGYALSELVCGLLTGDGSI